MTSTAFSTSCSPQAPPSKPRSSLSQSLGSSFLGTSATAKDYEGCVPEVYFHGQMQCSPYNHQVVICCRGCGSSCCKVRSPSFASRTCFRVVHCAVGMHCAGDVIISWRCAFPLCTQTCRVSRALLFTLFASHCCGGQRTSRAPTISVAFVLLVIITIRLDDPHLQSHAH